MDYIAETILYPILCFSFHVLPSQSAETSVEFNTLQIRRTRAELLCITSTAYRFKVQTTCEAMEPSQILPRRRIASGFLRRLAISLIIPVSVSAILYHIDSFNPVALPLHELTQQEMVSPKVNNHVLSGAEFVGSGKLVGPEDLVYDAQRQTVYTGCADGWIKRVELTDSVVVVEDWVNTGGRPLGLAFGIDGELIIADAYKGLLNLTTDGKLNLLTDEAEGIKLKFTDGVDVARDGMIYFTDASSKYGFADFIWDVLEGKPHGRLMSFNPITKETKVLARDLYFPNGVTVSHDQKFVIFCETVMRRCKKYIRDGEQEGHVETFVDNLSGMPDNIKYDGQGCYWIALSTSVKPYWEVALQYPFIRKVLAILTKYIGRPHMERNSGLLAVDLQGKPIVHYYDQALALISSGAVIGDYLYFGSVFYSYIIRLNVTYHPAT